MYCSVVLRPPLPAANAQTATIGAAVAVCRAVQTLCGLELAIKWVNDLYYKGKKVCGIPVSYTHLDVYKRQLLEG